MTNRIHFSDRRSNGPIVKLVAQCTALWQYFTDTRRLSQFAMVQEPVSIRDLRESLSGAGEKNSSPVEMLERLREVSTRLAVAEVTLTSGLWPLRKSRRVRVVRPSASKYWTFEDGEYTPGVQCEELERKWALQYDLQRQFLLKRNLDTAPATSTPNT
jgi:hypothetical protein